MRYFFLAALCLVISGAVYAQNIVGTGIFGDALAPGGCPAYTSLAARLDGSQNVAATRTAICGLVSDGIIGGATPILDVLDVFATNSSTNALVNWVSNTRNPTIGASTCTFTANAGYACDGVSGYLNSNFSPGGASQNASQNSATAGVCDLTSNTAGTLGLTQLGLFGSENFYISIAGGTTSFTSLNDGGGSVPTNLPNNLGSWVTSRNSTSTTFVLYNNGAANQTITQTSGAPSTVSVFIDATNNNNGGAQRFLVDQIGYVFFGGGMTGTQVQNVYNRLHTYMGAVGAPAGC